MNSSQSPSEILRAGGHTHDRCAVESALDGTLVPRGSPTKAAAITQVCSLSFYGMYRINEVLQMPLASRTYSLHKLPNEERSAEALTYVERWFTHAHAKLQQTWCDRGWIVCHFDVCSQRF
ncbi:Hypothetical protein PHPALM_13823 [Phytophthora palmivora]|uniref:Uncharacterized protein n=1 Tax=Phytophthora palmivora TaxID=4796 RepID=A0A2P4XWC2_9STRA|nr:Hypothetical protein PHPALM_13823 [Phytophthora palmivora]